MLTPVAPLLARSAIALAITAHSATAFAQPSPRTSTFSGSFEHRPLTLEIHGSAGLSGMPHSGWDRLCTSPCSTTLPVGTYKMALLGDGERIEVDDPVTVAGPSELRGTIKSNATLRGFGVALILIGPALGVLTIAQTGSHGEQSSSGESGSQEGAVMGGLFIGGGLVGGFALVSLSDKATITLSPVVPASSTGAALERAPGATLGLGYAF